MAMASNGATPEPFRFLDLPKDIRLMVYERLPRSTNHLNVGHRNSEERITLISHSVSTAILRACHQIYQEALPLVNKAIREWVENGGVKIISTTNIYGLSVLAQLLQVLFNISEIELSKAQLTLSVKVTDNDVKADLWRRISRVSHLSVHDVDEICAGIAKSALVLNRWRRAIGVVAAASALPAVDILLSSDSAPSLTLGELRALAYLRTFVQRQLTQYKVPVKFVGFINAAYLGDSITPCTLRQDEPDVSLLTVGEWYRTWK